MSPWGVVQRQNVLQRLRALPPRLISIVASAGYGKSTLAQAYARAVSPRRAVVDCTGMHSTEDFSDRLLYALGESRPAFRARLASLDTHADRSALLEAEWKNDAGPRVITVDRAEELGALPDAGALLRRLLSAPSTRRIVLCARRSSLPKNGELLHPHDAVALRARDLQFDEAEIAGVLSGLTIPSDRIESVAAVTWGWAAALLFLRRYAIEGALAAMLESVESPLWAPFHEYVAHAVVDALSPHSRAVLFSCVAFPALHRQDLEAVHGPQAVAVALQELIADLSLVREGAGSVYTVHPLVAATIASRYNDKVTSATAALAQTYSARDPLHAAPLYLRAKDSQAASVALQTASLAQLDRTSYASSLAAAALDRETLLNNLPLFNAAVVSDYYRVDVNDWLLQAQEALRRAPASIPPDTRRITLCYMTIRYALAGRFSDGHARIEHERTLRTADEHDELQCELMHAILDANADVPVDIAQLRRRFTPVLAKEYFRGLFARRIAAPVAALWGDVATTLRELELAFVQARKHDRTPFLAETAIAACFEAWLHMDAPALQRWRARLQEYDLPAIRSGTALFVEALDGTGEIGSERFETMETRARAYLIAASRQDDARRALALAKRALRAAEALGRPLFIVLARVALACIEPGRDEHLRIAREHAHATPSLPLQEAVEAIAAGRVDHGMLAGLTRRFARSRIPLHAELHIQVLSGRVLWNDAPAKIEQRPLQLLLFLALQGVPMRAEEIVASLWPERSMKEMANALRVHISAIRSALAKDAVRYENERYSLACSYVLDLQLLESRLRRMRRHVELSGPDRRLFVNTLHALETYHGGTTELPWLVALQNRVNDVHFDVLIALAREALFAAEYPDAVVYAKRAAQLQPWDERACEIAVQALLQQGERTKAVRHYRLFADELARSLGIEPSPTLSRLVLGGVVAPTTIAEAANARKPGQQKSKSAAR